MIRFLVLNGWVKVEVQVLTEFGHSGYQFFGISDFMKRKFRFLETFFSGIFKVYKNKQNILT
jgi:hypothetical protein